MRKIEISDNTIRHATESAPEKVSFKLKLDTAKQLDMLGVSAIETSCIKDGQADYLLVKSIASAVRKAVVSVPVDVLDPDSISITWKALKDAVHPRLQLPVPCSAVQMEYFCHQKPAALLEAVKEKLSECASVCEDVEFVALDFTRSDKELLSGMISAAVEAGAGLITVSDIAGNLLPEEFFEEIRRIKESLPEGIKLGVQCSNALHLADCNSVAAVRAGADVIKTEILGHTSASLNRIASILNARQDVLDVSMGVRMTEVEQVSHAIKDMLEAYQVNPRAVAGKIDEQDADKPLSTEPVPETYHLESYIINSGNIITSTCHLRIRKDAELLENVSIGNGPVDAAFKAMETLVGSSYELDDFKIRSVTEGREAMGETIISLRNKGKLYYGKGVSTDIVGSSILAYLDAANKIAYEEDKA